MDTPHEAMPRARGADDPGPHNPVLAAQFPSSLRPPETDHGNVFNFWFPFDQAHMRQEDGGWAREVTVKDLAIAKEIAGVNMRLKAGAIRELHWHLPAEWAYMLYGRARITAVDTDGRDFVADVGVGDLWYFPSGIPHSIQGLEPDGCEFLLAFDDGGFSEYDTFQVVDWMAHAPRDVLAKNFGVGPDALARMPGKELYIFPGTPPPPLPEPAVQGTVPHPFSFRLAARAPDYQTAGGEVRIADSRNFTASRTIAAALVTLHPGALRELHWHPHGDEWQYWISGQGRMTVFAAHGQARTIDFHPGDVGYVPRAMGHYIENSGAGDLRYLELFRADRFADVSLARWLAHTPPELVKQHLRVDSAFIDALPGGTRPVAPG